MRVAPNRIPDSILEKKCQDLGMEFVSRDIDNGKSYVQFICPKHSQYGIQRASWCHFKDAKFGCLYCHGRKTTTETFIEKAMRVNPDIEIIGEYVSAKTKIQYRCLKCNKIFSAIPNSIMCGQGCPDCGIVKRTQKKTKSHDKFVADLFSVQPSIEVKGEYTGTHRPIRCKCKIDGCEWESYPSNLLNKSAGCPECRRRLSKGEESIANFLDERRIEYFREYSFQDCRNILPLRFDFYLPENNIVIEYDGQQHFYNVDYFSRNGSGLEENQKRDEIKTNYCKENGIRLIRIPYYDFKNIHTILNAQLKAS